jgi:hypothetical protein
MERKRSLRSGMRTKREIRGRKRRNVEKVRKTRRK